MDLNLDLIKEAAGRLSGKTRVTPLVLSEYFSTHYDCQAFLKLENFQIAGSFKLRGAYNKISTLVQQSSNSKDELVVITASAGNHGQGVAWSANALGIQAKIVVPVGTPLMKIQAIEALRAEVIEFGANYDEAYSHAREIQEAKGYDFIPAFNDPLVLAGQGTIGLEILRDLPDVDAVFVPIGGGGLISGIATAIKSTSPGVRVYGVQTRNFPFAYEAVKNQPPGESRLTRGNFTIAEGIAVKQPGDLTLPVIRKMVDEIFLASENRIARAILRLMERQKIVVEGAGAVTLALPRKKISELISRKKVVFVISGGNIDINLLDRIILMGLGKAGRYFHFSTLIKDRPGELLGLLEVLRAKGVNVLDISHNRRALGSPLDYTQVEIECETRNASHIQRLMEALKEKGYRITTE